MAAVQSSSLALPSWSSTSQCSFSNTPAATHPVNRRCAVGTVTPNEGGRCRHAHPLVSTYTIAVNTARSSAGALSVSKRLACRAVAGLCGSPVGREAPRGIRSRANCGTVGLTGDVSAPGPLPRRHRLRRILIVAVDNGQNGHTCGRDDPSSNPHTPASGHGDAAAHRSSRRRGYRTDPAAGRFLGPGRRWIQPAARQHGTSRGCVARKYRRTRDLIWATRSGPICVSGSRGCYRISTDRCPL